MIFVVLFSIIVIYLIDWESNMYKVFDYNKYLMILMFLVNYNKYIFIGKFGIIN